MIKYENVMQTGFDLLKEESEAVYGCEEKEQAEAAIYMAGVVDTVFALRDLFKKEDN